MYATLMQYRYEVRGANMKHHILRIMPEGVPDMLIARSTNDGEALLIVAALNKYKPQKETPTETKH